MEVPDQAFASRLKGLRLRSGKSLQQAADAIGISKPHLWELETGKARNPTRDVLVRLADFYRVSVSALLGETAADEGDPQLGVLFRELREMDEQDRKMVQGMIDMIKQRNK